jgi:hypothetical protein
MYWHLSACAHFFVRDVLALTQLDGAAIDQDELQRCLYGPSTALAVLAYKRKRNIVNRRYQTQADNIVGKMTIAALDRELLTREAAPSRPVRIQPLHPAPSLEYRDAAFTPLAFAGKPPLIDPGCPILEPVGTPPIIHPGAPVVEIKLPVHGTGIFQVFNGAGGWVGCPDADVGHIFDPAEPLAQGGILPVTRDPHLFNVRGLQPGRSSIAAGTTSSRFGDMVTLVVQGTPSATVFHPGVNHGHTPCGRWSEVQANPNSSTRLNVLCKTMNPKQLVGAAILGELDDKPLAKGHVAWYLSGSGANFPENVPLKAMLERDSGVQQAIRNHFLISRPKGQKTGKITMQYRALSEYAIKDFEFAFGTIDRLDFEVDLDARTVHVWFQDRYEWHPVYPGLYTQLPGDDLGEPRPTNCVHAAMVELKNFEDIRAADFWMQGETTVPANVIFRPGDL